MWNSTTGLCLSIKPIFPSSSKQDGVQFTILSSQTNFYFKIYSIIHFFTWDTYKVVLLAKLWIHIIINHLSIYLHTVVLRNNGRIILQYSPSTGDWLNHVPDPTLSVLTLLGRNAATWCGIHIKSLLLWTRKVYFYHYRALLEKLIIIQ